VAVRQQPAADSPDAVLGGKLELDRKTDPSFAPNNVGLLLDEQGHLLVPLYVEREAVGDKPVPVAGPDGAVIDAKFIGSDRQTNLTLLEIQKISGKPVHLAKSRPASGSLVLCLSTADGSGRLSLWTDGAPSNGVIVNTDAQVCGIARSGQFLAAPACELISEHLARFGAVKRATLGITVSEVRDDDSPRPNATAPAGRQPAVRVDDVIPGSVADKAGIKPGDLLLSLAGEPVTDLPTFAAAIAARDGPTDLQLLRGDKLLTVSAFLQQQK
jgi:S1-C subfamily serine protease